MTLEELIESFDRHDKQFIRDKEREIKAFKKEFPDSKEPEHFKYDFSLPAALRDMCKEILALKNKK